ncbi:phosphopantetheine-binding protein [uncultured Pseudomonas sp.]|uniref:phosphopantetheine-binding protein n=1 Tax=uncultured Pseudomonas sp. TaxID=114707 RepID=UPI003439D74A
MIAVQLGIPVREVRYGYGSTLGDLGADEYDLVELVMALDTEFDISISDDDLQRLETPWSMYQYMLERLGD